MSTYTQFLYQLVFGSKDHNPFLSTKNDDILFAYIAGILKKKLCHSYIVGGAVNHVHMITHIHPTICPTYLIKDIKEATHVMICRERSLFPNFPGWQVLFNTAGVARVYSTFTMDVTMDIGIGCLRHQSKSDFQNIIM
jgi:REP-associated tyrosine transposase